MQIVIENNLTLMPISLDFADEIFGSFDSDIVKYLLVDRPPARLEETIEFINHSVQQMTEGKELVWVILVSDQFAGCCGFHDIPSRQPHFGLWIKKEQQGKGTGKKVVKHALHWGIENLDVDFIKYPVDIHNHRSISLINNLGLVLSDHYEMGQEKKLNVDEYRLYK